MAPTAGWRARKCGRPIEGQRDRPCWIGTASRGRWPVTTAETHYSIRPRIGVVPVVTRFEPYPIRNRQRLGGILMPCSLMKPRTPTCTSNAGHIPAAGPLSMPARRTRSGHRSYRASRSQPASRLRRGRRFLYGRRFALGRPETPPLGAHPHERPRPSMSDLERPDRNRRNRCESKL
jgi:hypothetical protein